MALARHGCRHGSNIAAPRCKDIGRLRWCSARSARQSSWRSCTPSRRSQRSIQVTFPSAWHGVAHWHPSMAASSKKRCADYSWSALSSGCLHFFTIGRPRGGCSSWRSSLQHCCSVQAICPPHLPAACIRLPCCSFGLSGLTPSSDFSSAASIGNTGWNTRWWRTFPLTWCCTSSYLCCLADPRKIRMVAPRRGRETTCNRLEEYVHVVSYYRPARRTVPGTVFPVRQGSGGAQGTPLYRRLAWLPL